MGADFVVTRTHEVLGTTIYVGIIAKVGRIPQDHSDIERQIEECFVPRPLEGGRRRERFDEIWVMTSGTISANAQEKIFNKYAATKVQFVDRDPLTRLIDEHVPDFWANVDPRIGEFLSQTREASHAAEHAAALTVPGAESFYVRQDVYRFEERRYSKTLRPKKPPKPVEIEKEVLDHRVSLVEAPMGAGKSKLLRHLALTFADPETHLEKKVLPVPITYREYQDAYGADITKLIDERVGSMIPSELRQDLTVLVLIDALDEKMQDSDDQAVALSELAAQVKDKDKINVVVSGRPLATAGEGRSIDVQIQRYEIGPLTINRLVEFLTILCSDLNLHTRIIEDIKKSQLFKELPRSPIAAILLARLLRESSKDLPSNLTELYAKYAELMLGRWDIEKGLQSQKEYDVLDTLLMELAQYMIENDLPGVAKSELRARFVEYLQTRNLDIDPDDLLKRVIERSGLLSVIPSSQVVQFRHRSFAEFLYGKLAARRGLLPVDQRALSAYWANAFFFKFGVLRDCASELEAFLALTPTTESERWGKRLGAANLALAAYTTPYELAVKGLEFSVVDAAQHYLAIVSGEQVSDLVDLSRMHLLWLFQLIMRQHYGYGYFKRGFDEVALRIDDSALPPAVKAYALFLLTVCSLEAGGENAFAFLLEKHAAALPLDLTVAVHAEASIAKQSDDVLKKQERRLRRALQSDDSLKRRITDLFEVPVRNALPKKTGS